MTKNDDLVSETQPHYWNCWSCDNPLSHKEACKRDGLCDNCRERWSEQEKQVMFERENRND